MAVHKPGKTPKTGVQACASITFPPDVYETLEDPKQKDLPFAGIVRDSLEKYGADQRLRLAPTRVD